MKKLLIAITLVLAVTSAIFAQAPQKFRYQAVARDINNLPYSNTSLRIRFAITEDSNNGAIRYFEEQTVNTSALGLFETNIGGGTVLQGSMSGISWGTHPYFVRVELNPDLSGGNFTVMGVSQLLSVPYALYAESAGGGSTGGSDNQELSLSGNQLSISGGNAVTLPDVSTTNEIQVLSLSGNILSLSNGGGTVNLPSGGGGGNTVYTAGTGISITGNVINNTGDTDNDDTNELQNLSLTGNTLSLSNGGGEVTLPSSGSGFSLPYSGSGSDPDAVFEVTNDGPGIGVLATSTNAGYAGVVAYNTGSGTSASLAGPDYGGYFTGPLLIHSIGSGAPLLEMYDASGTAQMHMGTNSANAWRILADNSGYSVISNSTGASLDLRNSGLNVSANELALYPPAGGGSARLVTGSFGAELKLTNTSSNTFSSNFSGDYLRWARDGSDILDIPFSGFTFEPWSNMGMDLGTSNFRWFTLYAAATNLASDRRLKENIKPTQYGLSTVMQLRPVDYFWKNKKMGEKQQTGFIAQELETVMPDVVSHDTMTPEQIDACKKAGKPVPEITDPYGVNYDAIIPVLVKGMQEQQQLIEQLQQQNQLLTKRLEILEKK